MTEPNIFQEVQEDLERQRLERLWKLYGPFVLAGAVLIVLATAGTTAWNSWRAERNRTATAGLLHILTQPGEPAAELTALSDFAQKNAGTTQASLARLEAAALAAKQNDKDKALQIYGTVADDQKADPAFRQFAQLMQVALQLDSGDPTVLNQRLQPLAGADQPFHYTAREYQGYLALRANDKPRAKELFTALAADAHAPHTISERAQDVLRLWVE